MTASALTPLDRSFYIPGLKVESVEYVGARIVLGLCPYEGFPKQL